MAETKDKKKKRNKSSWIAFGFAGVVAVGLIGWNLSQAALIASLRENVTELNEQVAELSMTVEDQSSVLDQVNQSLASESGPIASYQIDVESVNGDSAQVKVTAVSRYEASGIDDFECYAMNGTDKYEGTGISLDGNTYTAELELPIADGYSYYIKAPGKNGSETVVIADSQSEYSYEAACFLEQALLLNFSVWTYSSLDNGTLDYRIGGFTITDPWNGVEADYDDTEGESVSDSAGDEGLTMADIDAQTTVEVLVNGEAVETWNFATPVELESLNASIDAASYMNNEGDLLCIRYTVSMENRSTVTYDMDALQMSGGEICQVGIDSITGELYE